jgi:hypothetical protein
MVRSAGQHGPRYSNLIDGGIIMDWKRKLTSRKFWAAVAEFVTMLIVALNGTQETATQVAALIMAGAGVIAYIVGEGLADAAGAPYNIDEK